MSEQPTLWLIRKLSQKIGRLCNKTAIAVPGFPWHFPHPNPTKVRVHLSLFSSSARKIMAALIHSSPNLSSPFLGHKLSIRDHSKRSLSCCSTFRSPRCSMDASYGGGGISKFPRSNVWDPYKRLGVSTDASEEEVWSSRNFLLNQFGGHERSAESIEAAFEKILMASFINRKKTKINLKSRLKKQVEESPSWVKNLFACVEVPPRIIIFNRLFLFGFMAVWSVLNSVESGPAFQVALSLGACIFFLNDKSKNLGRASIIGLGSLVIGWICGSIVGPLVPSILLHPTWTLELLTSLVAFVFLFAGCTFLK